MKDRRLNSAVLYPFCEESLGLQAGDVERSSAPPEYLRYTV